jgi:hypothetical protein
MASEKQIEANRKNASKSSGPKTDEGKAKSRANATKHGMAVESTDVEASISPEFLQRRADWAAELQPNGQAAGWALDRAVAASLRIERCERTLEAHITDSRARAMMTWDEDRDAEAGRLASRLAKEPSRVARELETSRAGVIWLLEAWLNLAETLEDGRDWSEPQAALACDRLGQLPEFRDEPSEGDEPARRVARLDLAHGEIDRLKTRRDEALTPLDAIEHKLALEGDIALLSKPAARVLRYERDAWKRYRDAMAEVQASRTSLPSSLAPMPQSKPAEKPVDPEPSFEEQRRAIREAAAPFVEVVTDELRELGIEDEDAYLAELERRIDTWEPLLGFQGMPPLGGRNELS